MIYTELLKFEFLSKDDISNLVTMINDVYLVAEGALWKNNLPRTTLAEVTDLLKQGRIIVAKCDEKIVGSVAVTSLDNGETCSFGMLVADESFRGRGVGRALIDAVADYARAHNFVRLQLELLEPRIGVHTSKQFLRGWYTELGFSEHREEPIDKMYPSLSEKLAVSCQFSIWYKDV